jgi:hypothetical protein
MTARDRLVEALKSPGLVGLRDDEADELVANFAHELAEQIRSDRDDANVPGSPVTPDIVRGMSHAADGIDPYAE